MFTKTVALLAINIFLAQALPVLNPQHKRVDQLLNDLNKGPITHTSSQTTSTSSHSVSESSHNVPSTNVPSTNVPSTNVPSTYVPSTYVPSTNTLNFRELLKDPTFVAKLYVFLLQYRGASNSQSSSSQISQLLSSSQLGSTGQAVGSNQSEEDFRGLFSNSSFLNFLMSFFTQSHKEQNQNQAPAPSVVATTNQGVTNTESQITTSEVSTQINGHSRPVVSTQDQAISGNNQVASVVTVNQVSNQNQVTNQNQQGSNQNEDNVNNQASSVILVSNQNQVVSNQNQAESNQNQVVSTQNQVVSNQNQEVSNENQVVSNQNQLVSEQNQVVSNQNQVLGNENQATENGQASSVVSLNNQNQVSVQNQVVSNQNEENVDNQVDGNNAVIVSQTSENEVSETQDSANEVNAEAVPVIPEVVVPSFNERFGAGNENTQTVNTATTQVVSTGNDQEIVSSSSGQASHVNDISSSNQAKSLVFNEDLLRLLEQWLRASSNKPAVSHGSGDVGQSVQTSHTIQTSQGTQGHISQVPIVPPPRIPFTPQISIGLDNVMGGHSGQLNQGTQGHISQVPIVPPPRIPFTPQISIGLDNVMGGHATNVHQQDNKQVYNAAEELKMAQNAKYEFANQVMDELEGNFQERAEVRDGTKVYGKYGSDDGFQWRTVYYEADENGYRVTKTVVKESRMHKNPEGTVNVQSVNNGSKVNYHITRKDISHVPHKKTSSYGVPASYGVRA